jgi:hypothetical protein
VTTINPLHPIGPRHTPCSGWVSSQWLLALAGPVGCRCPGCSVRRYVAWLRSAESGPQTCSGRFMTQAADWPPLSCPSICISTCGHWPEGPAAYSSVVGPARSAPPSAARGPACSGAARGPARGAARVSPKKPSRSRPVVRPCWPVNATGLDKWYSSEGISQHQLRLLSTP